MAHRRSRRFLLLAAMFLLLAATPGAGQQQTLPSIPMPAGVGAAPKPAEPAAQAKEFSAQEIDALIEKAFG